MPDLAYAPSTSTTSALLQLLVAFTLIGGTFGAIYIWAAVLTARVERRRAAFPPPAPRRPVVREPLPTTSWEAPEPAPRHAAGITRQIDRTSLLKARHALRGAR